MNSEPPSDATRQQDSGLPKRSRGRHVQRRANRDGSRSTWSSVAAVAGVLAVAGGVAGYLFLSSESDPPAAQAGPARGLACPYIQQAAAADERGDRAAFDRAIAQAAKIAEATLQKSGQVFGEPERIALELELSAGKSGGSGRPERLLVLALRDCRDMENA